ncbi:MAG: hypothetical protein H6624_20050 [Bdellovibrionaceae bacterium]|nr:hypothetical protein [Pseudobdellovibrionaceae bacterium]
MQTPRFSVLLTALLFVGCSWDGVFTSKQPNLGSSRWLETAVKDVAGYPDKCFKCLQKSSAILIKDLDERYTKGTREIPFNPEMESCVQQCDLVQRSRVPLRTLRDIIISGAILHKNSIKEGSRHRMRFDDSKPPKEFDSILCQVRVGDTIDTGVLITNSLFCSLYGGDHCAVNPFDEISWRSIYRSQGKQNPLTDYDSSVAVVISSDSARRFKQLARQSNWQGVTLKCGDDELSLSRPKGVFSCGQEGKGGGIILGLAAKDLGTRRPKMASQIFDAALLDLDPEMEPYDRKSHGSIGFAKCSPILNLGGTRYSVSCSLTREAPVMDLIDEIVRAETVGVGFALKFDQTGKLIKARGRVNSASAPIGIRSSDGLSGGVAFDELGQLVGFLRDPRPILHWGIIYSIDPFERMYPN